jgi:hypothetical protein
VGTKQGYIRLGIVAFVLWIGFAWTTHREEDGWSYWMEITDSVQSGCWSASSAEADAEINKLKADNPEPLSECVIMGLYPRELVPQIAEGLLGPPLGLVAAGLIIGCVVRGFRPAQAPRLEL